MTANSYIYESTFKYFYQYYFLRWLMKAWKQDSQTQRSRLLLPAMGERLQGKCSGFFVYNI